MYEAYYRLNENPFAPTADSSFIFRAAPHRRALALLEYSAIMRMPFCLVTGEPGCGKSTLIGHFLDRLREPCTVGVISATGLTFGRLLHAICESFGLDHAGSERAELRQLFRQFLLAQKARRHTAMLIVDDAHKLGRIQLEELRMMSNINDKRMMLQIVLVGRPQLRADIRSPDMLQLAQRIGGEYHIAPLSALEARRYIYHRLHLAGGPLNLFDPGAIAHVHGASGGIPRLINKYCELALLRGGADGREHIDAPFMLQVIEEQRPRSQLAG